MTPPDADSGEAAAPAPVLAAWQRILEKFRPIALPLAQSADTAIESWSHDGASWLVTSPVPEFTSLTSLRAMQTEGILNGERDIVTELIDMFLEDTPPWLVALHEALLRSDARDFAQAAHSLKGSCGTIGVKHMAMICAALEESGRQGHLEALETSLDDLSAEFQRVRQVLEGKRQCP